VIPVFAPIVATATLIASTTTQPTLNFATGLPPAPTPIGTDNGPTLGGIGTYIVQPGETLSSIAARYGSSVLTLARLNGIVNPQLIRVGQVLAVPGPGNNTNGRPPLLPTSKPPSPTMTYIVRPGDTLYSIGAQFHVTVTTLVNLNDIADTNLIYVGQVLVIPVKLPITQ